MPVFELESGKLVPAQFGHTVEGDLPESVFTSVRAQVLEIIGRPLFPITWRDLSRGGDAADMLPRLTALDGTGQVVSVEVLPHLTSQALISALSRLADVAALSWMDLAREFPGGVEHFRLGWLAFRDAMPSSPGAGPRLIMVVHSMDADARAALEVLSASGVEVHELSCRQMSNGRLFIDVNPVGARIYAHVPQLVSTQGSVDSIESSSQERVAENHHEEREDSAALTSEGLERIELPEEPAPVTSAIQGLPFAHHRAAPVYPRVPSVLAENLAEHEPPLAVTPDVLPHAEPADTQLPAGGGADEVPRLQADARALQVIAALAGEELTLTMKEGHELREPMALGVDGLIRVGQRPFADVNEALAYNGYLSEDGWREVHLADPLGPTLREALKEVNADLERSYRARH